MVVFELPKHGQKPYILVMASQMFDGFTGNEWAAFWRSNESLIMNNNGPTIFTNTIRIHPWRDYTALCAQRMNTYADRGCLKVHTLEAAVSTERPQVALAGKVLPHDAMAKAIELYAPDWSRNVGSPLSLVP